MKFLLSFLAACATTFLFFFVENTFINLANNRFVFADYKLVQIMVFIAIGFVVAIPLVFWPIVGFVAHLRKSWAPYWLFATATGSLFLVPVLIIDVAIREKTDSLGWPQLKHFFINLNTASLLWLLAFACGGAMFGGLYSHLRQRSGDA